MGYVIFKLYICQVYQVYVFLTVGFISYESQIYKEKAVVFHYCQLFDPFVLVLQIESLQIKGDIIKLISLGMHGLDLKKNNNKLFKVFLPVVSSRLNIVYVYRYEFTKLQ